MTIDVYPAYLDGQNFDHADDWNEESTLNMATGNFYGFFYELMGEHNVPGEPGHWNTKFVHDSLKNATFEHPRYTPALKRIIAIAQILEAPYICYA